MIIPFIRKLLSQILSQISANIIKASRKITGIYAHQARQARAKNTANASAIVVPATVHQIDPALISPNAVRVIKTLQQVGYHAFIVGGAVRDLLLGRAPKDFDVATNATPNEVRKCFQRAWLIGRRFQIVHVQFGKEVIEVSTFRAPIDTLLRLDPRNPTMHTTTLLKQSLHRFNRRAHAIDASGRVLRDNVWGAQHEDAARRDFTINAMYYDPITQTLLDYHHGMADMQARLLRMIGDPTTRYREDPVRMLRVIRFAAKLKFDIDAATRAPIRELSALLNNVPTARLFDEVLKLLLSGHALACLMQLRAEGLHHSILPLLDPILEQPQGEKFITLALTCTDKRIQLGKPVSAGFLFAALLWHEVRARWQQYTLAGDYPIPALYQAMDTTLNKQMKQFAIQRRYISDMKELWGLQPRLEKRGRNAYKLLEHQRFKAAYDFLLLRCAAGELDPTLAQWWTDFIAANTKQREVLLAASFNGNQRKPRQRRQQIAMHEVIPNVEQDAERCS